MGKRKGPTPKRQWEKMYQTRETPTEAHLARMQKLIDDGVATAEEIAAANYQDETWRNDTYRVSVTYLVMAETGEATRDGWVHLSIHTHKRRARHDWRELQAIKNDVMGEDREAIEIYPASEHLVDTANEFHLWVMPVGTCAPVGFRYGRDVSHGPVGGPGRQRGETIEI